MSNSFYLADLQIIFYKLAPLVKASNALILCRYLVNSGNIFIYFITNCDIRALFLQSSNDHFNMNGFCFTKERNKIIINADNMSLLSWNLVTFQRYK